VRERVLQAAETLRSLGADVAYIRMPFLDYVIPTYYVLSTAEASSNLARLGSMDKSVRSEEFGDEVIKRTLLGTFVLSAENYDTYYQKALQARITVMQKFDEIFQTFDVLLLPTSRATAPRIGSGGGDPMKSYLSDMLTVSANLAGLPALTVPAGFDAQNLPIGAQFVGRRFADIDVLRFGHAFQRVTDYHKQTPHAK